MGAGVGGAVLLPSALPLNLNSEKDAEREMYLHLFVCVSVYKKKEEREQGKLLFPDLLKNISV